MIVASNTHTDCYDINKQQWYSMRNFEDLNRCEHCMMLFDGAIIIAGGNLNSTHFFDVRTLDTATMKWVHLTKMKQARSAFALVACNKELYACGGYNRQSNFILEIERMEVSYDGRCKLKSASPLPVAFKSKKRPSTVSYKGRVLLTGMSATEYRNCGPILMYTPATNKWEVLIQSPDIGECDSVYLITEYEHLFIVSFKIVNKNQWQPRVQECDLVCDDAQAVFTIVRDVKQNEFVHTSLPAYQIGKKVYMMCNDFSLETVLQVSDETEVISLYSYRQLSKVNNASAVNVLALDWKKISLTPK